MANKVRLTFPSAGQPATVYYGCKHTIKVAFDATPDRELVFSINCGEAAAVGQIRIPANTAAGTHDVEVTFDKSPTAGRARLLLTSADTDVSCGHSLERPYRPIEISFADPWLKEGARAIDTTETPLAVAKTYNAQIRVGPQAPVVALAAKLTSKLFAPVAFNIPANAATHEQPVTIANNSFDYTEVKLEGGNANVAAVAPSTNNAWAGLTAQFVAKPNAGLEKKEVELGKEYEVELELNWWTGTNVEFKFSSALLTANPTAVTVAVPASGQKRRLGPAPKPLVKAKLKFDKWADGEQDLSILVGDYTVGARSTVALRVVNNVSFAPQWLTASGGADADPENKPLELYANYKIHLELASKFTEEVSVEVLCAAFGPATVKVTFPPGATKASADVQTKGVFNDWTPVKLQTPVKCTLPAQPEKRCWVEAPTVDFTGSPLALGLAAIADLLKLNPGKHTFKFKLSYAPHKPPPGATAPSFNIKSTAFDPAEVQIPLREGVTSFTHEVSLNKATAGPVPVEFTGLTGCVGALMRVGRVRKSDAPKTISIAVLDTTIEYNGIEQTGPYEDGQTVNLLFMLRGAAGPAGASATLKSNAFTADIAIAFPANAKDGATLKLTAVIQTVEIVRAITPPLHRYSHGFEHPFELATAGAHGRVSLGEALNSGKMKIAPNTRIPWHVPIPRPRIALDPAATPRGPYKPADKCPFQIKLLDGPPKHTPVAAKLKSVVVDPAFAEISLTPASRQASHTGEFDVADIIEYEGPSSEKRSEFELSKSECKKGKFAFVEIDPASLKNCVLSQEDDSPTAVAIGLDLLEVQFHSQTPYQPETGLFSGSKMKFAVTHSRPAPAGAEVKLKCVGVGTPATFAFADKTVPLTPGKLFTSIEVDVNPGLKNKAKYTAELEPVKGCIVGDRDSQKIKVHPPVVASFGGKRKPKISPDDKKFAPGASVTLTVSLDAPAPLGGCDFFIDSTAFVAPGFVTGKFAPNTEEVSIPATLSDVAGADIEAALHIYDPTPAANPPVAIAEFNGCRVSAKEKENKFTITIEDTARLRVSFDDTVSTIASTDQATAAVVSLKINLSAPTPRFSNIIARVSSRAFTAPVLVTFPGGAATHTVTATLDNKHGIGRHLVRVDGVRRCSVDEKATTTRTDPEAAANNKPHLFTIKFTAPPTTPIQPCPLVQGALAAAPATPCAFPLFTMIEKHGASADKAAVRGASRDGVFPVSSTPLLQVIAGREVDKLAVDNPEYHRTELLFRFPGANNLGSDNHDPLETHPAIQFFETDKDGNRTSVLPFDPAGATPNAELQVVPGNWDNRYPIVAKKDIRGLLVHQPNLWGFESNDGRGSSVKNKMKRSLPLRDFWNFIRQQNPRLGRYEVEAKHCGGLHKTRIEVYPSDEFSFKLSIKPFAPFSYGYEGAVVKGTMDNVKQRDDLTNKSWSDQYYSTSSPWGDPKFRDQSTIASQNTQGSVGEQRQGVGTQRRMAPPKLTVAALNEMAASVPQDAAQEITFQVLDAGTVDPGTVVVVANDYVFWEKEPNVVQGTFTKVTAPPGSASATVAELLAMLPADGAFYKAKKAGAITLGLVKKGETEEPGELTVALDDLVSFDAKTKRWRAAGQPLTAVQAMARAFDDLAVRKLSGGGTISLGNLTVATGDTVVFRAATKGWEIVDPSTTGELAPPDQSVFLENDGANTIGARVRKAGEWEKVPAGTTAELSARVLTDDSIYTVTGGGTVGGHDVSSGGALHWSGGAWKAIAPLKVEEINPNGKADETCREGAGGDCKKWTGVDWQPIEKKSVDDINALVTPADGQELQTTNAGVLTAGSQAVSANDLVKLIGGAWKVQSPAIHDAAWFAPPAHAVDTPFQVTNSGKIEPGNLSVSAEDIVRLHGGVWAKLPIAGAHPADFYNNDLAVDGAHYFDTTAKALKKYTTAGGFAVVPAAGLTSWETSSFSWAPVAGECYRITADGDIGTVHFAAGDIACFDGSHWVKHTKPARDAEPADLSVALKSGDTLNVTDPANLTPAATSDFVRWDAPNSKWDDIPAASIPVWSPIQFDSREADLLHTYQLVDVGTLEPGSLVTAIGDFVWYNANTPAWEKETGAPDASRHLKIMGYVDDVSLLGKFSVGTLDPLPLKSTELSRSSYCFYPTGDGGGLPETWKQTFASKTESEKVEKQLDENSAKAGFIPSVVSDRIKIALTRNGVEDSLCAEFRRLCFVVATLIECFTSLTTGAEGAVPTHGFSVSGVIGILEGDLTVRWGWKEFTDHQVFYWEQVQANLMLFRIGARVDFGFRYSVIIVRAELVIYFKITLELGWEKAWERRGPGESLSGDPAWSSAKGKIEGGASLVLLHENWCSSSASISSGIEAKMRWIVSQAGGVEFQVYFLGITFNFRFKIIGIKEFTFTRQLKKGSPPGQPWKRGMIPGGAASSYYNIRATFGLSAAKIQWDRNHLLASQHSMVMTQQDTLKARDHEPGTGPGQCVACNTAGIAAKAADWPRANLPGEAGWDEQWAAWVKSTEQENRLVRLMMRHNLNAVVKHDLKAKCAKLETDRKRITLQIQDRLALTEQRLDEIAALERRVDDAEAGGDERLETLEELLALANETKDWLEEIRFDDPSKAKKSRVSVSEMVADARWWVKRMEHYTSFQQHWKGTP